MKNDLDSMIQDIPEMTNLNQKFCFLDTIINTKIYRVKRIIQFNQSLIERTLRFALVLSMNSTCQCVESESM